jgi:branched-chain amino acid transport system substrate-binding protein
MTSVSVRVLAVPLVLALLVVACGQKPGVHVEGGPGLAAPDDGMGDDGSGNGTLDGDGVDPDGSGGAEVDGTEVDGSAPDQSDGQSGNGQSGAASPSGGGGDGGNGGSAGGAQAEGDGGGDSGGDGGDGGGAREPQGEDRTGVSDDTITMSFHAPVTGAAPLPATVFEEASDLYWRWIQEEKGQDVLGRSVEVIFRDDRYEPTTARQVCRELMSRAFSVSGAGADGISACGQLAAQTRVPYFSVGGGEVGVAENPWFFGLMQSYDQQAEPMASLVADQHAGKRVGTIAVDTNNFDGAVTQWESQLDAQGIDYHPTLRHPRGDTSWYASYANELGDQDVDVVYMLTSPLDFIRFSQVAMDQGHDFHFLTFAPGGLNAVLENGCPGLANATALSGWPGLDAVDDFDPEFRQAVERYGVSSNNLDLSLAVWGANKSLHKLFEHYEETFGNDLTREDFRALSENASISSGVFPDVQFAPDRRFGGTGMYVLEADCDAEQWRHAGST